MKRKNVLKLEKDLEKVKLSGSKFTYILTKNKRKVKQEADDIRNANTPSEKFKKFEKELEQLKRDYAEKDENGNPVIESFKTSQGGIVNHYKIENTEDETSEFRRSIKALEEKYKDTIEQRQKEFEDFKAFLEEDMELNLRIINIADVPDNITQEEMDIIFDFIEE